MIVRVQFGKGIDALGIGCACGRFRFIFGSVFGGVTGSVICWLDNVLGAVNLVEGQYIDVYT